MKALFKIASIFIWTAVPVTFAGDNVMKKDFDDTWNELKRRFVVGPENVASDGNIEIIASQRATVSQFGYSYKLILFFRNVSDKPIKVPTSTGNKDEDFSIARRGDGTRHALFVVATDPFMGEFPIKRGIERFAWLELQPGEVGQSREFVSGEKIENREMLEKIGPTKVQLFVSLIGDHGNVWQGDLKVWAGKKGAEPEK